ncbi:Sec20-domain-containing protein [Cyathus striatus]|nr:Sec20-domain-containing protein [Cyathus striatus]
MPPIPINFDSETVQLIESIERRHKDLAEYQIPRLESCRDPLATQQRFAAELREDLDLVGREIEALSLIVDDQMGEKNRRQLGSIVKDLQNTLAGLRKDFRAALLASKRAIDAQSASQRHELLGSAALNQKPKQDLNEKVTDDALMKANSDVTEALRRTIAVMQGELERSVLTTQMLDSSSATLRTASSQHDTLSSLMTTSKQLITALEKSDWLDRILMLSAFAFFLLVILFILKQRFIDRTVRIAFWWTRFLPGFRGAKTPDVERGLDATGDVEAIVSASIITAASIISSMSIAASSTMGAAVTETPSSSISKTLSSVIATSAPVSETLSPQVTMSEPDAVVHEEL